MPTPKYSVLADARYGKRGVVKFGGAGIPIVQSAYANAVQADTPVSWWRLADSLTATTIVDSAGSNPGTATGFVIRQQIPAISDNTSSMYFGAATNSYIQIPFAASIAPTPNFSLEAWFLITAVPGAAGSYGIADFRLLNTNGFVLIVTNTGALQGIIGTGATGTTLTTAGPVALGVWHHAVLTYDGANGRLYLDGVLVIGPTATAYSANPSQAPRIGYNVNGNIQFTGFIEDVALYSTPLSAARVLAHFNAGSNDIDLADGVSWFLDDKKNGIEIKTDHKLVSTPYIYRAKSALQSEDYLPTQVLLSVLYDESSGVSLQQAIAALYGNGTQYLTFDNATGMLARFTNMLNRRMRVTSAPYLWEGQLEFVGYEPWWKDMNSSVAAATALNGSVSPGASTLFNFAYPGNFWAEPVFTLYVPSTNAAPITQLVLLNQTNVQATEQLTVFFSPALSALRQWIITIDCGAFTVTDQTGTQYDFGGTFPLLYPPAGTTQFYKATLITQSGASAGVMLAPSWVNRWVP